MAYFKFVEMLPLVFALCFVPTIGQMVFGCLKGLVCNLEPFITQCCTESFQEETLSKKALTSCLFSVVQKEATACLTGSGRPTESGEEEDSTEAVIPEQEESEGDSSIEREDSESSTFRNLFRQRNRKLGQRRNSGRKAYSDIMKNEDCQKLKTSQPNGTEECPAWSESLTRCVNQIPLVNFICQMGSGISGGFGQGNFGGGAFGGFGQGGFGGGGFGGLGQGSSFGGMGSGGFGNGRQGPFRGMGDRGFGFGNKNNFGTMGNGGFGKGTAGDKENTDFEMIGGDKFRPPFQSSDREYESLPEWKKKRKHFD